MMSALAGRSSMVSTGIRRGREFSPGSFAPQLRQRTHSPIAKAPEVITGTVIQGTPVQPARLESRASSVTAPSIQPLSQVPPMAAAGVDTTQDGVANFVYVGPDLNRNGIPDALEATSKSWNDNSRGVSPVATRMSSIE